jgi:Reverse transcriptase (RNA-dependent DNA polymerase)
MSEIWAALGINRVPEKRGLNINTQSNYQQQPSKKRKHVLNQDTEITTNSHITDHNLPIIPSTYETQITSTISNHRKRDYTQIKLFNDQNSHTKNMEYWGDLLTNSKTTNSLTRICFRNIKFLPAILPHTRHDELIGNIHDYACDIFGMAETNVCWHNIPKTSQPQQRFKNNFETVKCAFAFNSTNSFNYNKQQFGGTLLLSTNNICSRVLATGYDNSNLGRWCWTLYRGSNAKQLRIITLYRPVISNCINGVYNQHKINLLQQNIDMCPRQKLLVDLERELEKWKTTDEYLIVMGDFNENIHSAMLIKYFNKFNMREITQYYHKKQTPNSHERGTVTIDGIFATKNIPIRRCGYTPINWGISSDHRMVWADMDLDEIFGTNNPPLWKPAARRLKLENPAIVNNFITTRLKHATENNLLEQLQELKTHMENNTIDYKSGERLLNSLDNVRVDGIKLADKQCRRLNMGMVPWSPELSFIINQIQYYRLCVKRYSTSSHISTRTLYKLKQKARITVTPRNTDEAKVELNKLYKSFKTYKHTAGSRRISHLEQLAGLQALEKNANQATILRNLIKQEYIKDTFRKINAAIKPARSGVSKIEVKSARSNSWKIVNDKVDIEKGCINENIRRFSQAQHTPPMQELEQKLLGKMGENDVSDDIINGNYNTLFEQLHPDIQQLIPFLKKPNQLLTDINCDLTNDEMRQYWKNSKEKTSTGISGLHYGHFIASSNNNILLHIDTIFMELSIKYGFLLNRWCKAIDVMIPKKADSIQVTKLRTIMLFECDWNQMNKIIGKKVMKNAELYSTIAKEQYGSRENKSAIQHATNKSLLFDLLRQRRMNVSLIILDALSCFDRIALVMAAIGLRRQGVPKEAIKAMFEPLIKMTHYIRTTFGDSTQNYTADGANFHGIGQGNGAGPVIWATCSSPLLDQQRVNKCGIQLKLSNNNSYNIPAFTFVDDNDMCQEIKNILNVSKEAQRALNLWDKSLKATGGACAPEKCSWTTMIHIWKNNKWTLTPMKDSPGHLILNDDNNVPRIIKRVPAEESTQALGIMFSPSGNIQGQFLYLRGKCQTWADKIITSHIPRADIFTALNCTIMKTVEYSLIVTTMSRKQCDTLSNIILMAALPKSGICRTISRRPIFAPAKFQGFGIKNFYFTQGYRKLMMLCTQGKDFSLDLMDELMLQCEIECGLGPQFLTYRYSVLNIILEKTFLQCLWEFCDQAKILVTQMKPDKLRMTHDYYLMTLLPSVYTKEEIRDVNCCRIFLRVETLSDILSLTGKKVRSDIWSGLHVPHCRDSRIWPRQPFPGKKQWETWRRFLQTMLLTNENGQLSTPIPILWFADNLWSWYINTESNRVYELIGHNQYREWIVIPQRKTRQFKYQRTARYILGHKNSEPCTIKNNGSYITIESILQHESRINKTPTPPNFIEDYIIPGIQRRQPLMNRIELKEGLENGEIFAVSDGSHKETNGSGAWVISSPRYYPSSINGSVQCPGYPEDMDSHRCECIGILGAIIYVNYMIDLWHLSSGSITFVSDNKSAINYSFNTGKFPNILPTFPDFDILQCIRQQMKPTILYKFEHVKGHQDLLIGPKTFQSTLNILADALANCKRNQVVTPIIDFTFPSDKYIIKLNKKRICKNFEKSILEHWSTPPIQDYWEKQRQISKEVFSTISWESIKEASELWSQHKQRWLVKHCIGIAGVKAELFKWKKSDTPFCSRCGMIETTSHVWRCNDNDNIQLWEKHLTQLSEWLDNHHTEPTLKTTIINNLRSWLTYTPTNTFRNQLEKAQDLIGWDYCIEGVLPILWADHQNKYFQLKGKTNNGFRWLVLLINKLWLIAWDLWQLRNEATKSLQRRSELHDLNQRINKAFNQDHPNSADFLFSEHFQKSISSATTQTKKLWLETLDTHISREYKRKRLRQTKINR